MRYKISATPGGAIIPVPQAVPISIEHTVSNDVSIDKLIDDSLLALSREVKQLLIASSKGKLSPTDARDLRDHTKLLFELKDREKDFLKNLSEDQLQAMLNSLIESKRSGAV